MTVGVGVGGKRLLRLCLTDGHSEITAIKYFHVPSIPDNMVSGTEVRLENKVAVHNGTVCLNPKALTVLGEDHETGGPPPFVKLQVGSSAG
ncbi:hypothetical protein RJT34_24652 [Clitoria ternatea]|uniref:RecQ mediated genome instability protein 1 OB-fold domain-containing protein n=1 Tax=Clitoria ternatea TaxID=43366 RepID=A0AAN9FNF9_CLITE